MKASPEVKEKSKDIYKKLADITQKAIAIGNIEGPQDKSGKHIGGPAADVKNIGTDQKPLGIAGPDAKPNVQKNAGEDTNQDVTPDDEGDMQVDYAKNPKLVSNVFKSLFGKGASVLLWAMDAENKNSTGFIRGAYAFLTSEMDKIKNEMKTGKAKAEDINKAINGFRQKFKESIQAFNKQEEIAKDAAKKAGIDYNQSVASEWKKFNPRDPAWKKLLNGMDKNDAFVKMSTKIISSILKLSEQASDKDLTSLAVKAVNKISHDYEDDPDGKLKALQALEDKIKDQINKLKPTSPPVNKKAP
jgi:hypothetical protein